MSGLLLPTFPNQWTVPAASNLFVESERTKKDLVGEFRNLAKDLGGEFGLWTTMLDVPDISGH